MAASLPDHSMVTAGFSFLNGPHGFLQLNVMAQSQLVAGFAPPHIAIDQNPVAPTRWGGNLIACPPGRHTVRVWLPALLATEAAAEMNVEVAEGQILSVFYAPPRGNTGPGSIGTTPPKRRISGGLMAGLLCGGAAALFGLIILLVALLN